jgi:hypothetical protein
MTDHAVTAQCMCGALIICTATPGRSVTQQCTTHSANKHVPALCVAAAAAAAAAAG